MKRWVRNEGWYCSQDTLDACEPKRGIIARLGDNGKLWFFCLAVIIAITVFTILATSPPKTVRVHPYLKTSVHTTPSDTMAQ